MSSDKFAKAGELFHSALALPFEERLPYLKNSCAGDESLLQEVESLLAAHQQAEGFMQTPAADNLNPSIEDQLSEGQLVGPYKIIRVIGRGGMGAVYLAVRADERFQKSVAIKLIKRGMITDEILRRFRNEQQILGNLDHPNIARLLDAGTTENGLPYFIMEYVEGVPIDQYCDQQCLSITNRLELFQKVCSAVSYAHRNLVVHRDIKPTNILVTADGVPKLLDFGVAKILQANPMERSTMTGMHFMTPEYASPEQAQGLPVTTLSDLYSLGVLLYELLTGRFPYQLKNRSPIEILRTITETQPQLPSTIILDVKDGSSSFDPDTVSKTREGSPDRLRKRLRGDLDNIVLMALRKEPQRRYQSVDQLSDDIRRHLQGLPIAAHKDTIAYRASRFILRNRVVATIVVLSLLILAVFGAVMQWRANKQAKLFQEFGQEVSRIEAFMRYAYLLPLHNIERDKNRVTDRLNYIKKRMQVMGSISYGPGYYSIGRGYLSLHQYQDAYDNLIVAWRKHGYQEPAAANALGISLSMIYQKKLNEVEETYNKESKEQRKMELEKQYRLPALQFIQKGANASESPEYVQAIVAFLGKNYSEALNKARTAEKEISWHYESRKLQGDIFVTMGNEQADVGNIAKSYEFYQKAKSEYLEAARKGQSDPQIYNALCTVQAEVLTIQIELERKSSSEGVDEAIKYCEKALQLDSKDITANLTASRIYKDWAFYQNNNGNESSKAFEKAVSFANSALKIDSENALAHVALGEAYSARSDWEGNQGRDPFPLLDLADASFTKASKKLPDDTPLMFQMANDSMKRAQYLGARGKDPRQALDKAIGLSRKITQMSRQNYKIFTTIGHAYYVKGNYEAEHGLDPTNSYNESVQQLKQSMKINPNYLNPYIWCGNAYMGLADYHTSIGKDPNQALDDAIEVFKQSLVVDPKYSWGYSGIGIAQTRKGKSLLQQGKDPTSSLETARQAYKKSLELDPSIVFIYSYFADAEVIAARDAMNRHKSPEPFLKQLEEIVQACFKVNAESDDCLTSLSAGNLLRSEYFTSTGRSAESEILLGIKNVDHALKINSTNAYAHAYRGRLFLIRAQTTSGLTQKQHALQAKASFDQAFKLVTTLHREFAKHSEEAKRLSQS